MDIIEITDLVKIYDSKAVPVHALSGISLSFTKGEFSAIVGPSGSGKTTLLNIIGGLDEATSGTIFIEGRDIGELKANQMIDYRLHHIGFVFQAYNLIPVLSARENVELIMELQGWPRAKREQRAKSLLQAVDLADRLDARPGELSGGQQQRVAVARALASKPSFILADEPTANLDSVSAENLLDIMANLNREENITFIFSTHDPRVMNKARRIITLQDGKVVKDEAHA